MSTIFVCKECGSCPRSPDGCLGRRPLPFHRRFTQIPPSSPVYNVTYVTQSTNPAGVIQASYTAGYFGTFVAGAVLGAILADGTGYYYPPYIGYPAYGYPIYRPYAATYGVGSFYNPYTGAYGAGRGVYGPYRRGCGRCMPIILTPGPTPVGQQRMVHTEAGVLARHIIPTPGPTAATRQGSSPYGSWGQSVVSQGKQIGLYPAFSTANGTVGTAQGSKGGAAAGASTKYGNTAVAKTSSGDMYAAHDGNVYKNTGSGWNKYDNGNWNPVQQSQRTLKRAQSAAGSNGAGNQAAAQQRAQNRQGSQAFREKPVARRLQSGGQLRLRRCGSGFPGPQPWGISESAF